MSLCNFRTFTIILVLELAVLESQVESFTIQRTPDYRSDLDTAASSHLEVRNDLKRNVKPIEAKNDSPPLTVPIETTAKTEEIQKNVENINRTVLPNADTTLTSTPMTNTVTSGNFSITPNPSRPSTNSSNTSEAAPTVASALDTEPSSPAATERKTNEYSSKNDKEDNNLTTTGSSFKNLQENPTNNISSVSNKEDSVNTTNQVNSTNKVNTANQVNNTNQVNSTYKINKKVNDSDQINTTNHVNTTNQVNITKQVNATRRVNTINRVSTTKQVNNTNVVNTTDQVNTIDRVNTTNQNVSQNISSVDMNNVMKNKTRLSLIKNDTATNIVNWKAEESNEESYSTKTVKVNHTIVVNASNNDNDIGINDSNPNVTATTNESIPISPINDNANLQAVDKKNITEKSKNSTEALTGDYSGKATPYWKKYTTIERKRYNTTKDTETSTEKDQDLLQSGTAQTQTSISLEKALNIISDIPSLEQLKNDLLALNKVSSTTESMEATKPLEIQGNNTSIPTINTTTQKLDILSSKRAGFLDFSTRPMNSSVPNNGTEKTVIEESVNVTEVTWNFNVSKPKTTPQTLQHQKSMTSQSLLVEDAINEELMKEEILNDNVENAKRMRDELRFGTKSKPVLNVQPATSQPLPKPDTSSEDKLRVKPISTEKLKNGSIYTVSPNYKPLKKIEVLPPKPFMRNPDDNSWRNESLSSLGIVFKANNSSKPFTQVLKNKTEIEWNSLLENYRKGDEPELRTRLEKIAEMRKTKKKKVNALGETVYTDYEEPTSGENSNSSNSACFEYNNNVKNTSSFLDKAEMDRARTTQVYTSDDLELTTKKSQKLLDEYEDDDEEDYTLPNIDLKRYFTPTAAAPALLPSLSTGTLTSAPVPQTVRTYPPDRQPTLQYFPPREKPQQKVVINDYDTVFRQKVNAYTYDTPSKNTNPQTRPAEVTFNFPKTKIEQQSNQYSVNTKPNNDARRPEQMDRNIYITQPVQDQKNTIAPVNQQQDGRGYDQASYVIKHLRDFIDVVVKADEASAGADEVMQGVTVNSVLRESPKPPKDYYDYEAQFRKDVLNRFVENFNQNSERFKVDFPVLYNTSVVHSQPGIPGSGGAESTAFMKRLYEDVRAFQHPKDLPKRFDPHCDRTVELSPAYELHYYIPEEEEKEEIELKPVTTPPHRLRL